VKRLQIYNGYVQRPFPNGHKCPLGCNGYVTAMAGGQRQRLYSGVRILTGIISVPLPGHFGPEGSNLNFVHWFIFICLVWNCGTPRDAPLSFIQTPLNPKAPLLIPATAFLLVFGICISIIHQVLSVYEWPFISIILLVVLIQYCK